MPIKGTIFPLTEFNITKFECLFNNLTQQTQIDILE